MFPNGFRGLLHAGMILSALATGGCGNNTSKTPADRAEKVVETFLDAWTRGESPDKFADPNQPIQATDPDWKAGYRLLSFLSVESKQSPESPNEVRCRMALSLQDRKGKKVDKEVVYRVQVGEKSVIGRW